MARTIAAPTPLGHGESGATEYYPLALLRLDGEHYHRRAQAGVDLVEAGAPPDPGPAGERRHRLGRRLDHDHASRGDVAVQPALQ
jgi:hypothetical protein